MTGLTPDGALQVADKLLGRLQRRRPQVEKRQRYFRGEQPLAYASEEWRKFHGQRFAHFADNWCGIVAKAAPERTEVFGLRLGDDPDVQSPDERDLWRDWDAVDGPAKMAQGVLESAISSTSYALVWADPAGEPLLTWETASQAVVDRDPETGATRYGLKAWADEDTEFLTLYTPDELWKFERARGGLRPSGIYLPEQLSGGWSRRAEGVVRNPFGVVPLVEFPNRPLLDGGPVSDIEGTMAMQDAANLMWAYLFGAADYASMPARVVMGQEPPKVPVLDKDGRKVGEKAVDIEALTRGRMLWLTGQDTKIGAWEAAKLDVFTDVINVMVKHIASQTQTPIRYIMGELGNVNGDTVQATDFPLATKVRQGHKHLTGPTRQLFRLLALVRGQDTVAEACRTAVVQWRNPETMQDAQISDAASKDAAIGWPFAAVLERRYGLSQPEIQRVMAQREAEALDPILSGILKGVGDDARLGA